MKNLNEFGATNVVCSSDSNLNGNVYVDFVYTKAAVDAYLYYKNRVYENRALICKFLWKHFLE